MEIQNNVPGACKVEVEILERHVKINALLPLCGFGREAVTKKEVFMTVQCEKLIIEQAEAVKELQGVS